MKWFLNLNAALKLMLSSAVLLAVTVVIGGEGLIKMSEMNRRLDEMYSLNYAGMLLTKNVEVAKMEAARSSRNAILKIGDNAAIDKEEKDLDRLLKQIREDLGAAEKLAYLPEIKEQFAGVRRLIPEYEEKARQVFKTSRTGDVKGAKLALEANSGIIKKLNQAVRNASSGESNAAQQRMAQNQSSYESVRRTMMSLLAGALLLGIVLSLWIARIFSLPLGETVRVLDKIAEGDFTKRLNIDSRDEIGRMAAALNRAVANIQQILLEVDGASKSVGVASQQLAVAAEKISSGVSKQAASLDETSASLEEITATVRQNSDNATNASDIASSCSHRASEGDVKVTAAMEAMSNINEASSKISTIVATIDELAFKTNMLAVNAAIEAARAGEHGRGFAVVSSEIRSLAQSCTRSAQEIKDLVSDSFHKVEKGSDLVNQSGSALRDTVESVKKVSQVVDEIAAASREQLIGVQHVAIAMTQIDAAMQTNFAQTEEMSNTASKLAGNASHLRQLVSCFTVA
jgi:methyl-accepting chemotaxis protein